MRERITFTAPVEVLFERTEGSRFPGWITNVLSDSEQGLVLTFTFGILFPGTPEGSAEETRQGDAVRASYVSAVRSTIDRTRQLAADGKL